MFALVLHALLTDVAGNQGEPVSGVGPLSIGQSPADVRRLLGAAPLTHDCDARGAAAAGCDRMLRYTDGAATLTVTFPPRGSTSSIEIAFARPAGAASRLSKRWGRLATWLWQGHAAGAFPPEHVAGWRGAEYVTGASCTADFEIPDISATYTCASGSARLATFTVGEH